MSAASLKEPEGLPRWHVKHLYSSDSHVPTCPGVYVIGHSKTYYGLELGRVYVYVGKTENLRRRLREHLPSNEQNLELRDYLRKLTCRPNCWYAIVEPGALDQCEQGLIRKLRPRFNRRGKPRSAERHQSE